MELVEGEVQEKEPLHVLVAGAMPMNANFFPAFLFSCVSRMSNANGLTSRPERLTAAVDTGYEEGDMFLTYLMGVIR